MVSFYFRCANFPRRTPLVSEVPAAAGKKATAKPMAVKAHSLAESGRRVTVIPLCTFGFANLHSINRSTLGVVVFLRASSVMCFLLIAARLTAGQAKGAAVAAQDELADLG